MKSPRFENQSDCESYINFLEEKVLALQVNIYEIELCNTFQIQELTELKNFILKHREN